MYVDAIGITVFRHFGIYQKHSFPVNNTKFGGRYKQTKNSIRDARTPQPGAIFLDIEVVKQYTDWDTGTLHVKIKY